MMLRPSMIEADSALRDFLKGRISVGLAGGGTREVAVYSDWERPTNELPADFITVYLNGGAEGVSMDTPFAKGYVAVSLYCKLNDDGSVKRERVTRILRQFEESIEDCIAGAYHFEYDAQNPIIPTTPNQTTGYSVTVLNLRWTTTSKFNQ